VIGQFNAKPRIPPHSGQRMENCRPKSRSKASGKQTKTIKPNIVLIVLSLKRMKVAGITNKSAKK
jgi:hypothetical protein